jgi:hypothetical protein
MTGRERTLSAGWWGELLAPVLEETVLLVVFRAAATESSPPDDGDRGIEQLSRAAEGLIRSQILSLFLLPNKQGHHSLTDISKVSCRD